jgi:hypothetical protein
LKSASTCRRSCAERRHLEIAGSSVAEVGAPEHVARLVGVVAEADLGDRAEQRAELRGLERRPRVDLRQHATELLGVVALDRVERPVDPLADVGLRGGGEQPREARLLRDPEDVLGDVLVAVLEDRAPLVLALGEVVGVRRVAGRLLEPGAAALEGVGDVLEEEQSQDEVLVLGGLDAPAQPVGRLEQLLRKGKVVVRPLGGARHHERD